MDRRRFLKIAGAAGIGAYAAAPLDVAQMQMQTSAPQAHLPAPDISLRIAPVLVELAPNQTISTIGYNGTAPGPILRMTEGKRTVVEVTNDTDVPELVHWHGQMIPSDMDGAMEEGTPMVPAHGKRTYSFLPKPAGTRWYHTHTPAGADLNRGLYTGQFGFVYIEPKNEPGQYDREVFLALHEWQPFFIPENDVGDDDEDVPPPPKGTPAAMMAMHGIEVGYRLFSINDKTLGNGEPIRVKQGDRLLFRVLNASATENRKMALPGHRFQVVSLDGNPVPTPQTVDVLQLGPAERIDAIVEMNQPGVWIFGCTDDAARNGGMGIVVEYEGQTGKPRWITPTRTRWDYTILGTKDKQPEPDGTLQIHMGKIDGGPGQFNHWTINGKVFPHTDPFRVHAGRRYRMFMKNETEDAHPMHLHRHSFELVRVDGRPTAGVIKDTVIVGAFGEVTADFVANQPGPTLYHCHVQIHMDFGFMAMFEYV